MPHGDHVGDLIDDYVFARGVGNADDDLRYMRRRVAAAAFVPGLLIVAVLGGLTHSAVVAVSGMAILVTATAVAIFLPRRKS
jgi:hypothetical protein